jgi:hypothetical protein
MLFLAAISQQELYYISAPKRIIADLVRVYVQPCSQQSARGQKRSRNKNYGQKHISD